ncbi:hypothetical protein [Rathayibacter rathayi]|uniref:HEAT repeat domain-containing protein n=1 Tax=Rathayibacter rathayi TaxID=33887 RepID=A0ABX5AGV7_RATRA|nr:hypothetical protein [Rathayibacter rathayi]PPF24249.1 hypothetical protein C5C34_05830 [Rathayibacter rathayi]PPF51570.1 hypothetical protein C5C08_01820 [Rathayibacter rathayi]PPF83161.1 hypothetical protein C5C14_01860 [Rathayibacter rathayi]PPG15007.1 hypothetical protein C5C11_03655 [Rathayibacter rathayi]PPG46991.1 hypothetical protein C5C20_01815 [Rathayibacter rathayi]
MPRCTSWRFRDTDVAPAKQLPAGRDHRVWRPCRNRVVKGVARCPDCEAALIVCPNTDIRITLAQEPGQTVELLEAMTTDPDHRVAAAAEHALARLDGLEPPHRPATTPTDDDLWS